MVETLLEEVREQVAESSNPIAQAKAVLHDPCDDVQCGPRYVSRRSHRTVDDLAEVTGHRVQLYLVPSKAGTLVFGLALGFVAGWLLTSRE